MGLIITLKKEEVARLKNDEEEISLKIIRLGNNTVDININAPKSYKITRDNYGKKGGKDGKV